MTGPGRLFVLRWHADGIAALAELIDGQEVPVADRDAAARLTNTRLHINRASLPQPDADEFYLTDLLGLSAHDEAGTLLGKVSQVHDYGAGVSLEIARQDAPSLLVPFTRAAVPVVDIAAGRIAIVPPEEAAPAPRAEAAE